MDGQSGDFLQSAVDRKSTLGDIMSKIGNLPSSSHSDLDCVGWDTHSHGVNKLHVVQLRDNPSTPPKK